MAQHIDGGDRGETAGRGCSGHCSGAKTSAPNLTYFAADSVVACADRLLRMLGEAHHPLLVAVLVDLRIDELAAQRFEAFERAQLARPISREYPRHRQPELRRGGGSGSCLPARRQAQPG